MYFILLLFLYCPRSGVISRQWWWLLLSLSDFLLTGLRAGQTTVFRSVRTPFWDFSPAVTTRFTDVGQSLTVRRCRGGKRYPQNCKFYENLEYTRTVGACPLRDSYKIRRGVYVPRNIGTVPNQGEDLRDGLPPVCPTRSPFPQFALTLFPNEIFVEYNWKSAVKMMLFYL